jgi:PAS domain S-box-containing protein
MLGKGGSDTVKCQSKEVLMPGILPHGNIRQEYAMVTDSIKLTDLAKLDELQKIQDSFALATGVGACMHEVDGTPITSPSNWCELCVNYHRKSEIGYKRCVKSDANLGARAKASGQPVIVAGQYIGFVTCGQVLYEPPKSAEYRNIAEEIGVNEEGYLKALGEVTIMPQERFQGVVSHLYQVANTISALGYQRLEEQKLKDELTCALEDTRRAVKQLEEEKAFNQAVVTNIADMLIAADDEGKWALVNPAFERIMGYRAEEVLRKETLEQPFVTPKALGEFEKMWQRVFAGEVATNVEVPWMRKDGQEVILSGAEQLLKEC